MSNILGPVSMENVVFDGTTLIITIIQLSYGVPSLLFMFYLMIQLRSNVKYANSFYRLVQLDLCVNICCFLNTWFAMRLETLSFMIPFLKFVEHIFPGFLTVSKYFLNYFMHAQFLSAAFLSIQRISVMWFSLSFQSNWSKYYKICAIITVIYSFLPSTLFFFGFITKVDIIDGVLSRTRQLDILDTATDITAVCSVCYFVIISLLALVTPYLTSRFNKTTSFNMAGVAAAKILTKVTMTYCLLYSGIMLWSVVTAMDARVKFLPAGIRKHNINILGFSSDLMTLSLPYLLLLFDGNVKKHIFEKKQRVVFVPSSTI